MRTIVIGDVHGCVDELNDLIHLLAIHPDRDRVFFIGDLINKGPASREVVQVAADLRATSILGNHELKLLHEAQHQTPKSDRYASLEDEFGSNFPAFLQAVSQWPRLIRLPGTILVHAGFPPNQLPEHTDTTTLANIRTCDGSTPWFETYQGADHVVFGHWAALRGVQTSNVTGLDTGCVYGGHLSALILEDRQLVQVPARKVYEDIT